MKSLHSIHRNFSSLSFSTSTTTSSTSTTTRKAAFLDGSRLPFVLSQTLYKDLISHDLARMSLKALISRFASSPGFDPGRHVFNGLILGTVVQEVRTSNLAREAGLSTSLPQSLPAYTVSMACISGNRAICNAAEAIMASKNNNLFLCGGAETFSDVPIRFSAPLRKRLLGLSKARKQGIMPTLKLFAGLKLKDLAPEPPAIKNFSTNEIMGHSSDRLAARFNISRKEQDEFAVRSHKNAAKAHEAGKYKNQIVDAEGIDNLFDNGIRKDANMEALGKLKPAFVKNHGTHTAGNSSFLTDGAASVIMADYEFAKSSGLKPKAVIEDFVFVGVDPFESMLLGPALAIKTLLERSKGLFGVSSVADAFKKIKVIEYHEAFAGQVLANFAALKSAEYGNIDIDMDLVNKWGGSLSIGHPFGATGARLMTTAVERMIDEDQEFALIAACADGGLAHACLLRRTL